MKLRLKNLSTCAQSAETSLIGLSATTAAVMAFVLTSAAKIRVVAELHFTTRRAGIVAAKVDGCIVNIARYHGESEVENVLFSLRG